MTVMDKLDDWGPMTVLMIAAALIVLCVGGAVVIINPETLTFEQYLDTLKTFAIAIAGLGLGRGILGAGKTVADAHVGAAALLTPQPQPSPGADWSVDSAAADTWQDDEDEGSLSPWEEDLEVADELEMAEVLEGPEVPLSPRPRGERPS